MLSWIVLGAGLVVFSVGLLVLAYRRFEEDETDG